MPSFSHGKRTAFWLEDATGALVDVSTYLDEVNFSRSRDMADSTTFQPPGGAKTNIGGLIGKTMKVKGKYDGSSPLGQIFEDMVNASSTRLGEYYPAGGTTTGWSERLWLTNLETRSPIADVVVFEAEFQPTGGLLSEAVGYWDARSYGGSGYTLLNLGSSGSVLDLTLGNGAGASLPKFLQLDPIYGQYIYFPGQAGQGGNYLTRANTLNWNAKATGTIKMIAHVALDDWTPSVINALMGTARDDGHFKVNTNGALAVTLDNSVAAEVLATSTVVVGFANGTTHWLQVVVDLDADTAAFYTSDDVTNDPALVTWVQLGIDRAFVIDSVACNNTAVIGQGDTGTYRPLAGKLFRATFENDGAVVADLDFTNTSRVRRSTANTFFAVTDLTFSIVRSATDNVLKTVLVDRPQFLLGQSAYMQAIDHADLNFDGDDEFTIMLVGTRHGNSTASLMLMSKKSGFGTVTDPGWGIYNITTTANWSSRMLDDLNVSVTTNTSPQNGSDSTVMQAVVRTKRVPSMETATFTNGIKRGSNTTVTNSYVNALSFFIGRSNSGSYADMEFFAAAAWRRALTDKEIVSLRGELGLS